MEYEEILNPKWHILLNVLRPYIFALCRLTRARQKPGIWETPLLFSIHPKGYFRCQDHRQSHMPLGLYYFSPSSAHWNTPPARSKPMTFSSWARHSTVLPPAGDLWTWMNNHIKTHMSTYENTDFNLQVKKYPLLWCIVQLYQPWLSNNYTHAIQKCIDKA